MPPPPSPPKPRLSDAICQVVEKGRVVRPRAKRIDREVLRALQPVAFGVGLRLLDDRASRLASSTLVPDPRGIRARRAATSLTNAWSECDPLDALSQPLPVLSLLMYDDRLLRELVLRASRPTRSIRAGPIPRRPMTRE